MLKSFPDFVISHEWETTELFGLFNKLPLDLRKLLEPHSNPQRSTEKHTYMAQVSVPSMCFNTKCNLSVWNIRCRMQPW